MLCCAGRTSDVLMRGVKIIEEGHLHKCLPNYQLPAFSLVSSSVGWAWWLSKQSPLSQLEEQPGRQC